MTESTSAYIYLLLCIFCFATSVKSNDADKNGTYNILLSFYTCNARDNTPICCLIQDLNCIENAYKLINEIKRENTVFIPGYLGNEKSNQYIISAYCSRNISTIALLHWSPLKLGELFFITNGPITVGRIAASTFDRLKNKGYNVETWHLIGHAMGAHVAGCTGASTNFSWLHITGLDPAFVFFTTSAHKICQMNPDVAKLTDIIHTDGNGYGTMRKEGKINIYVNTGIAPQPGCTWSSSMHSCSHLKAIEWYADSVKNETRYSAIKCTHCSYNLHSDAHCKENDYVYVGPHINKNARGTYCLYIN